MLTATFCCFDGLSASAERRLWSQGCLEWSAIEVLKPRALSPRKLDRVRAQVEEARAALEGGLFDYFLNRLPYPEKIRILPHVLETASYLDVETTGLESGARITAVALLHGGVGRCYVRGMNLDALLRNLGGASVLVTYNGASFDLPRLRRAFRIDLAVPHLDLRYCLEALGYRGGLKACERALGFRRPGGGEGTGADAVTLWAAYEEGGDEEALRALVRYNLLDVYALEYLAVKVYNMVMSSYPKSVRLPVPVLPALSDGIFEEVL